jgi:hypothetical protein
LTEKEALDGWISLFDGHTSFGWKDSEASEGILTGGRTTTHFGNCEIVADVIQGGSFGSGTIPSGAVKRSIERSTASPIILGKEVAIRRLILKPIGLKSVFDGRDLTCWKVIHHPRLPEAKQAKWSVNSGAIHAVGGPGALELQQEFGDVVLQIDIRTRKKLVNGGVFFRSIPGDFMNGYEAQIFNACYDNDPSQPARYSTGGIDDRQLARHLVSRDQKKFTMTVIANGPHIATWVNGYQMTDWTDTREPHENPRRGLRLIPGTIQLQAHDPKTDLEFHRIRIAGSPNLDNGM